VVLAGILVPPFPDGVVGHLRPPAFHFTSLHINL
jgi:hypothetical protein